MTNIYISMRDHDRRQLVINGNIQLFREFLTAIDIERKLEEPGPLIAPDQTAVSSQTPIPNEVHCDLE